MSFYRNQISCYLPDELAKELAATAAKRESTIAGLVRMAIRKELYGPSDPIVDVRKYTIFVTFALDELLREHPDPELRPRVHKLWREQIERTDADRDD